MSTQEAAGLFRPELRKAWLGFAGAVCAVLVFLASYETRPLTATLRNAELEVLWPRGAVAQDKRVVLPVAWLQEVRWIERRPAMTRGWGSGDGSRAVGETEFGRTLILLDRVTPPYLLVRGQEAPQREDITLLLSLEEEQPMHELFRSLRAELERARASR